MGPSRSLLATALSATLLFGACGGSDSDTADSAAADITSADRDDSVDNSGIRVVTPEEAAATIEQGADELVILDVRTQEEFDEAHIEGAVVLDFYRDDFADELATFDRGVPYVLYCRSGSRSSQARAIMSDLGFESVDDIDGGIVGWIGAGLPVVSG